MKRINILVIAVLAISVLMISGCGLKKMVKKYDTVKYEATPNPLEMHGQKIKVTVKGTIPDKYFHKKASFVFTPVLKYDGGSTTLKSITLKGEKSKVDGILIKKKGTGTFTYEDVIDYVPAMNKSELHANAKAKIKKKEAEMKEVKLADGVKYTPVRIGHGETVLADPPHGYEIETIISKTANIYFQQNLHNEDWNLPYNKKPENIAALKELYYFINLGWKIKNIDINAWASPEGEESFNQNLSDNRAKTALSYTNKQIAKISQDWKKNKKEFQKDISILPKAMGEDWEGFKRDVAASNIKDKGAILNVVNAHADKAKREQEIRNMAVIYKEIEDGILPALRRAEIIVNSFEPKKSKEEIALLSTTAPDQLDNKEILYAATLTEDLNTKLTIYKNATILFPQDWRGYYSAASVCIKLDRADEAATYLEKANSLSPNNPAVLNSLGILAAWKKDYTKAESYYQQAQAAGANVSYNFGPINIYKGDYSTALGNMNAKECDYNKGLAQLLNKENEAALKTLECAEKNAQTYYLLAIVGARLNNATILNDNLRKAIAADAGLKKQAKDDAEFIKFQSNTEFQNIVR